MALLQVENDFLRALVQNSLTLKFYFVTILNKDSVIDSGEFA